MHGNATKHKITQRKTQRKNTDERKYMTP